MSKRIIRYGIIGCGGIAHTHAEALLQIKEAKHVGVSVVLQEPIPFAEKYGIKSFDSNEHLLLSDEIDANNMYSSRYHAPIAISAAQHKKHAIIEKPLALTTESAKQVVQLLRKTA